MNEEHGLTYQHIESAVDGVIATLALNRPPRNIMHIEMLEEMNSALLDLRNHPKLKVLVIRGRGEAFSGGVDPADYASDRLSRAIQVFHRVFETMRLLDVIAVGAVDGIALGGGFELALMCNLIVASESARFGLPEIKSACIPPLACVVLPRAGPRRKAMEWILTGEEIPLRDLERFGLVNRVFPDTEFEKGLAEFLSKLTSMSGPVLNLAKRTQIESYYAGYEEALFKAENVFLGKLTALDDFQEGVASLLEKREPKWTES
jgi:enoyl-CoA hydratase/carnithine racemase